MGTHRISVSVNSQDKFKTIIDYYKNYEADLANKLHNAILRLCNLGVSVAYSNSGGFRPMVQFYLEDNSIGNNLSVLLIGEDAYKIVSTWVVLDENGNPKTKTAVVSPLLMAEFGSGHRAENPMDVEGVGQGTFPEHGHGDDSVWWWKETADGEWKKSSGIRPTHPMLNSRNQMMQLAASIFSEELE